MLVPVRKPRSPFDVAALAFAMALGLLAFGQWRAAKDFAESSVPVTARVVEIREEKKSFMEGAPPSYAKVAFTTESGDDVATELPTPIARLGVAGVEVGTTLPVRYDARDPRRARYGTGTSAKGAYVLLALAAGALFVPMILRRSSLASQFGGG